MAVNAFDFIAFCAKLAWRHTSNMSQSLYLIFVWFIGVVMSAIISENTILSQEVDIAHFQFFDPFYFVGVIFYYRVDTLAMTVARDCWNSRGCGLRGRGWRHYARSV